ncbi:MAG: hypothetical protein II670_06375 [Alphaproteobacteria bacterium]|nr:hypothetical protein [Alphaproteobacteria bacterium]
MYVRTLFTLIISSLAFSLEAKLSFSNIQGQKDFLNALLTEVEKSDASKKQNKKEDNTDIDKYKQDINTLKDALIHIEDQTAKQKANDKLLQDLVDDYNKKMKELEKTYRFIMSKSKKSKTQDEYLSSKPHEVFTIDSLDYRKKRRKIKDMQFRPLELVEISHSSQVESNAPLPSKDK